jgi:hypothetical protein
LIVPAHLDTSESDGYLYPASMFVAITLPEEAERVLAMAWCFLRWLF